MINILAEVSINGLPQFMKVFSSAGLAARRKHKSLESQVFETAVDPNLIFIMFKWEDRANFEDFLRDPEVKETMRLSGTTAPPKFVFLDKVAEFAG